MKTIRLIRHVINKRAITPHSWLMFVKIAELAESNLQRNVRTIHIDTWRLQNKIPHHRLNSTCEWKACKIVTGARIRIKTPKRWSWLSERDSVDAWSWTGEANLGIGPKQQQDTAPRKKAWLMSQLRCCRWMRIKLTKLWPIEWIRIWDQDRARERLGNTRASNTNKWSTENHGWEKCTAAMKKDDFQGLMLLGFPIHFCQWERTFTSSMQSRDEASAKPIVRRRLFTIPSIIPLFLFSLLVKRGNSMIGGGGRR